MAATYVISMRAVGGETYRFVVRDGDVYVCDDQYRTDEWLAFSLPEDAVPCVAPIQHESGAVEVQYLDGSDQVWSYVSEEDCAENSWKGPIRVSE